MRHTGRGVSDPSLTVMVVPLDKKVNIYHWLPSV